MAGIMGDTDGRLRRIKSEEKSRENRMFVDGKHILDVRTLVL